MKMLRWWNANEFNLKITQCKHLLRHHQNHTYLQFLHKKSEQVSTKLQQQKKIWKPEDINTKKFAIGCGTCTIYERK